MYSIRQYTDQFEIYELTDVSAGTSILVAPERGGIIIGYRVNDADILYLDKDTFYDTAANVRGGIPILFPICGALDDGQYAWNGESYSMKQHGFARLLPWEVVSTSTDGRAAITIRLKSSEATRAQFPFDFEVFFTYTLNGNTLTIDQSYHNQSHVEMPMYAGFHPYFLSDTKDLPYATDADSYLDYNDMQVKRYSGRLDWRTKKESAVFLNAHTASISFPLPDQHREIEMAYSNEFRYVVVWTVHGQPFICVEPWMATADELNRKAELQVLQPGETRMATLRITVK